ncbi:hypothetical protein PGTUg99_027973 [Puccinia graminis f. sp. tritici]|uniref:Uncharacterized protein n=1 Tax=Puccinia graminis f. sp. tritici TaxID=56615 RepID=A0A5B0LUY9_PUCGR|nr:hypothetical protein PGTUg99_027973 [Puccinia graminis f. sp. tritici]
MHHDHSFTYKTEHVLCEIDPAIERVHSPAPRQSRPVQTGDHTYHSVPGAHPDRSSIESVPPLDDRS